MKNLLAKITSLFFKPADTTNIVSPRRLQELATLSPYNQPAISFDYEAPQEEVITAIYAGGQIIFKPGTSLKQIEQYHNSRYAESRAATSFYEPEMRVMTFRYLQEEERESIVLKDNGRRF